jgi:ABC-type branched-subunit amino acid transport system substrate-binding protein
MTASTIDARIPMRRLFPLLLAALSASCNAAPTPIILAHIADFTGPGKSVAEQQENGIRLALDDREAEAAKDPLLRPIAVRRADDKGDPAIALGQAARLSNINRTVGFLCGDDFRVAQSVAEEGDPVFAAVGHETPKMAERVALIGLDPERRGKVLAGYLKGKAKSVVLLQDADDIESKRAEAGFLAAWPAADRPESWRTEKLLVDDASWKEFSEKTPAETLVVMFGRQAQTALHRPEMWGRPAATAGPELVRREFKETTFPIYLVTAFAPMPSLPDAEAFAKRYEEKFSVPAEPAAALAYESLRLAAQVAKKLPALNFKLRDELTSLGEFTGLSGKYPIEGGRLMRPAFVGRLEAGVLHDVETDRGR